MTRPVRVRIGRVVLDREVGDREAFESALRQEIERAVASRRFARAARASPSWSAHVDGGEIERGGLGTDADAGRSVGRAVGGRLGGGS